jgi:deoxyribodipyrimidine photo-lyase
LNLVLENTFYDDQGENLPENIVNRNKNFQQGGEHLAWRYLDSFVKELCQLQ